MVQDVVELTMLKKIGVIGTAAVICSCSIMPGMQNLDTVKMRKLVVPERIEVHPTLIPITPSLIADQRVSTYFYRVAPGAAGHGGYLVNSSGKIYFPLVGSIHVAGKTVDELRVIITKRLKKYVPNPQINVRVSDFRGQKVYVLGEVEKVGYLPINDQQLTIADALALSGWLDPKTADPRYIYIIRGNYTAPQIFWLDVKTPDRLLLAERFSLQPRDILYVSSAPIARLNRVLDQLLPIVQTVWFTKSVVQ